LNTENDLDGLSVAISIVRSEAVSDNYLANYGVNLVPVTQLQQKVEMLLKGRVDLFSHYVQSTFLFLEERGLQDKIVLSKIERPQSERYFLAISKLSPLYNDRAKFETMLSREVEKGAFTDICKNHYNVEQRSDLMRKHFCTES
jgi:polar amino acid transport system substrate-binding protein